MISPGLLEIICCPESHQPLELAPNELVARTNDAIRQGKATDRSGRKIEQPIDSGLIRQDGKAVYPVRNGLPELLIEKAIQLQI